MSITYIEQLKTHEMSRTCTFLLYVDCAMNSN
jgi:hypothetical protein